MNAAHLALMANQILKNFAVKGEDAAVTETAKHIHDFWEPRMIEALIVSQAAGEPEMRKLVTLLQADEF